MRFRTFGLIAIVVSLFVLQSPIVSAYEPTYNEILIQKERLDTFCKMAVNQHKYDICEKFESMKGKLPDRISEIDAFRRVHEKKAD